MARYRDDLESARLRVETLEAKLGERDAELAERDAALAARDAEIAELRAGQKRSSSFFEPQDDAEQGSAAKSGRRLAVVAGVLLATLVAVLALFAVTRSRADTDRAEAAKQAELAEAEEALREKQRALKEAAKKRAQLEERLRAESSEAERARIQAEIEAERARQASGESSTIPVPAGKAILNINCMPPSTVIVDGRPLGTSPAMGHLVPPGTHSVACVHDEKGKKSRSVSAKAGETKTVAIKL